MFYHVHFRLSSGYNSLEVNAVDRNEQRYIEIGLKIAYYRKKNGMTQEQLAERVGISPGYLSQVETQLRPAHLSENAVCDGGYLPNPAQQAA